MGNRDHLSRRHYVLLLSYYLRKYKGSASFTSSDLKACFIDALLNPPPDIEKSLSSLAKGKKAPLLWLSSSNAWSLSIDGLAEVETFLTSDTQPDAAIQMFLD